MLYSLNVKILQIIYKSFENIYFLAISIANKIFNIILNLTINIICNKYATSRIRDIF